LVSIVRIAFVALLLAVPVLSVAQEPAPQPMPRPVDRIPEGMTVPPTTATEATPDEIVVIDETVQPQEPVATPSEPATASEATAALAAIPQKVTLSAQITDGGGVIPSGLVWRVFNTKTDANGELTLADKSEDATATFELVPGEYVVHVAYGRAQASDTLQVTAGDNAKSIILDAGALRLNAAVTGDVAIPLNLLSFDIYTAGSESDQALVAENVPPNDIVTLNAGTYHVVSRFGSINASVRADLRVEPGQITDATLYHKAAQVAFKLVTEAGGEAIAAVEWTVKTADGTTVFTDLGAFPATVLAEGDYVVFAKQGDNVYNREFQVQAGPLREIEVLTAVY
jgi:hypothetical protein